MNKAVPYFSMETDQPQDRQRVWLRIGGTGSPEFATYSRPRRPYGGDLGSFHIVDRNSTHYPNNFRDPSKPDLWTPVRPPGVAKTTRTYLKHVGYDEHRLEDRIRNESEVTLATMWEKYNQDRGVDGFLGLLFPDPRQRDAKVAATIVQWLGTNVGLAFLSSVIRESRQMADYLKSAVSYRTRSDILQRRESEHDKLHIILSYVEKNFPQLMEAEPGSSDHNMLMLINTLRSESGLPWLDAKERTEESA